MDEMNDETVPNGFLIMYGLCSRNLLNTDSVPQMVGEVSGI